MMWVPYALLNFMFRTGSLPYYITLITQNKNNNSILFGNNVATMLFTVKARTCINMQSL